MDVPSCSGVISEVGPKNKDKRIIKPKQKWTPGSIGPKKKRLNPAKKVILKEKGGPIKKKTPKLDENLERITLQNIMAENEKDSYADFLINMNIDKQLAIDQPAAAAIPGTSIFKVAKQTNKKSVECNKCPDLKRQVQELKQQLDESNLERAKLMAENALLKEERDARVARLTAEREERDNQLLAGLNQLRKTVQANQAVIRNETANTIVCAGVVLNSDLYYKALSAQTISCRVRKIAAGYWSEDNKKIIAARKPPGVNEKDFLQICTRDYHNIDR
ncbi:uncharacterized protein LOC127284372 isoform X2 [Leptopilina boulardi]|uniref:uncharacterized protein LOC127284372 isoform X2 n=1 Tax=Leptopilina boulardi TaxID=63433 RepID=UPI0021F552CF|nr:uncharacterized protein LOC127284372 isoform X2 [Leptopilina boulardi]